MKKLLVAAALLLLAGCGALTGAPEDASPRERAMSLMARYELVQSAAEIAVTSPLLASQPRIKEGIKSASKITTAAVLAYDDAARGCIRNPQTGKLEPAPGARCEPEAARLLLPAAQAALGSLGAELIARGFLKN